MLSACLPWNCSTKSIDGEPKGMDDGSGNPLMKKGPGSPLNPEGKNGGDVIWWSVG